MYGASQSGFLPGMTEQGAGIAMDRGEALRSAAIGYKTNQKAQAAAKQITRSRNEKAMSEARRMQLAREQALLEMMYAHSVLGIPMSDLTSAVDMGVDMSNLQPQTPPSDNFASGPTAGQPLAGALGM